MSEYVLTLMVCAAGVVVGFMTGRTWEFNKQRRERRSRVDGLMHDIGLDHEPYRQRNERKP